MRKILHISTTLIAILTFAILPAFSALAASYVPQMNAVPSDPHTIACRGLDMVGIGCSTSGIAVGDYQPQPIRLSFDPLNPAPTSASPSATSTANLKAAISNATAPRDLNGRKINIVSVPESPEIYELVNGLKHPFPSLAIYYDYGYTLSMIQPITQDQLNKYPRAKLLKVKGDSKVYYLTEGGLIRQVIDPKKILDFYADRPEDMITISQKEFNFYPANEYVFQAIPSVNRDVFQISSAGKRYLTPMAVLRLGIRPEQIAPVSKAELDAYKTLPPVVD
jgi:hypothetical protein